LDFLRDCKNNYSLVFVKFY